jgi:type II secretory pathway pseudopilin PulG
MLKRVFERGDTLIEVLFAVSVFSFVVVGSLAIMNQGTAASQRSVEITLVREQMDAQAETLRFMHDSYVAVYQSGITFNTTDRDPVTNELITSPAEEWYMLKQYVDSVDLSSDDYDNTSCPVTPLPGSFAVDPKNVKFVSGATSLVPAESPPDTGFAQLTYNANGTLAAAKGIWIRAISADTSSDQGEGTAGYVDFHIRACWGSAGVSLPLTLGTIVRLYEPRG